MCKTIKQVVRVPATPEIVFSKLAKLVLGPSRKPGQKFKTADASGMIVDVKTNERIVEAWRNIKFAPGVYSMAAFTLKPTKTGTELTLIHRGVPKNLIPDVEYLWKTKYWAKLKKN